MGGLLYLQGGSSKADFLLSCHSEEGEFKNGMKSCIFRTEVSRSKLILKVTSHVYHLASKFA